MQEVGRAPLTFGQTSLWRAIEGWTTDRMWHANSRGTWGLPDDCTVASVRAALSAMVERHEGLRTGYVADRSGGVEQIVWHPQDLPVEAVELGEAGRGQAAEVTAQLVREPFALDRELPWRARIVTDRGQPVSLALAIHHITVDGWALSLLHDELLDLLAGRTPPALGMTCRDVAAQQRGPGWTPRRASATAYWHEVLTSAAPLLIGAQQVAPGPLTTWMARLSSPALTYAARALAARLKVTAHAVMLAAFCHSIARRAGEEAAVVMLMSGNRGEPAWRSVVSSFNQAVPLIVRTDPAGDLMTLAQRVHREAMTAYWNGCFDPDTRTETDFGSVRNGSTDRFRYFFNLVGTRATTATTRDAPTPHAVIPDQMTVSSTPGVGIGYPLYFVAGAASPDDYVLQEINGATHGDATAAHLESIGALIADQLRALDPDEPPSPPHRPEVQ